MADNIGTAYVQIEPSFEGVTPKIEQHFGGEGQNAGRSFGSGFGSVIGTVGKVTATAAAAGATAVAGLVKSAVSAYGDYEQLTGGIETLFEDLSVDVAENAAKAFQTAGLSANEYMETVMGFSASLNQSLLKSDGDISRSAEMADKAITDMADNANKMGSSMESIQNAYQGFAKQNYTMLDNLKLGYGGTKEEMQRLLDDASKLAGVEFDISSYADIIDAIHVVQENMGITGTTAAEAASTIQGSLAMTKASWDNLIASMGTGDANGISIAIDNLVSSAQTLGANVMPVIEQALQGISQLISQLGPEIAAALPGLVSQILPGLLTAGVDIIKSLGDGMVQAIPELLPTVSDVMLQMCDMLVSMAPDLLTVGLSLIVQLATGIAQALPELIPAMVQTISSMVIYLLENVGMLIDAALQLMIGLAEGLINAIPELIAQAPIIIAKLVVAILKCIPKIILAGIELVVSLVTGIVKAFGKLITVGADLVMKVKDGFSEKVEQAKQWGSDMIKNFINGIKQKWEDLKNAVKNVANTVKEFLGFSEPEEGPLSNFHTYAPDMMELFAQGIKDNVGTVEQALTSATAGIMDAGLNVEAAQNVQMSVNSATSGGGNLGQIEALLLQVIDKLQMPIVMDTGALVGATAGAYNVALGQIATRGGRR